MNPKPKTHKPQARSKQRWHVVLDEARSGFGVVHLEAEAAKASSHSAPQGVLLGAIEGS